MDKQEIARKNVLRKSDEIKGISIKGYDFNNGVDFEKLLDSFSSTGFQASNLARARTIIDKMISDKAFIYLGYTSNMISSGAREIIRYLVEHKKVNVCVTTCGGIEEDIIKCLGDFILGDFRASGKELREKVNDERSICYWAWKNKIRIFCPAISDGAIGDNIYFFKLNNPEFEIDLTEDIRLLDDSAFESKKTGVIILGAGLVKHAILNANMLRNGTDYSVYINTAQEFDGSDSGALPEEAISWGKILPNAEYVKVFGDATIIFPLLVAQTFAKK